MSYLTQPELEERLDEDELYVVASDNAGELDTTRIARALNDASDEIDTYLSQAYSLPLPTVPRILEAVCADLALYHLARGTSMRDEITERYEKRLTWLKLISTSKVSLGLPVAQEPEASESSFHGEGRSDFKNWRP